MDYVNIGVNPNAVDIGEFEEELRKYGKPKVQRKFKNLITYVLEFEVHTMMVDSYVEKIKEIPGIGRVSGVKSR